jgi:hypothetical protein
VHVSTDLFIIILIHHHLHYPRLPHHNSLPPLLTASSGTPFFSLPSGFILIFALKLDE